MPQSILSFPFPPIMPDDEEYEYEYEEIEIEEEIEVDEEIDDDGQSMELDEEKEGQQIALTNSPVHRPVKIAALYGCDQSVGDDDEALSGGRRTDLHVEGVDKVINPAKAVRLVHVDVQSKDGSFDHTAALDQLVDVKDNARVCRPCNGKNTTSEVSDEGETFIESKPVSDSNKMDQARVCPCNGKSTRSGVSAEGETCIETKPVSSFKVMDMQLDMLVDVNEYAQLLSGIEPKPVFDSKEIDTQLDMQLMDGVNKFSLRFSSAATMPRRLSPKAELRDRDKRPAILCRYFAKGWCIKADSCRFVHKSNDGGSTSHRLGGTPGLERCVMPCDRGSRGLIESPSSANGSQIVSDRHTIGGSSSTLRHKFSQCETGLLRFGLSSNPQSSSRLSGYRSEEEASLMHSQHMFNDNIAPGFGYSINQYHMRNHSSSSSALKQDQFGADKLFSGNRPDDAFRPTGYKSNFVPHNWEQSTPFLSSFSIPFSSASDPGRLDDTNPVGIEQPAEKNDSVNPSLGVGLLSDDTICDSIVHAAEKKNSVNPSMGVGLLSEGTSDSWNPEKRKYNGHEKEIATGEAESVATSVTDQENRTKNANDKSSFGALGGIVKASLNGVKCSRVNRKDTLKRMELKVDGWKNCNIEPEDMHWNSKSVKHFRAALVEYVKELMKPAWHEGHLTKDAYKLIVQKVEEKVTNSLLPNLIPSTPEHTKQYLSFSRTKLLNLTEVYAGKYGKHVSTQPLV